MEGESGTPLGERRVKRSPLRDAATMLRSFDYAAGSVLHGLATGKGRPPGLVRPEDRAALAARAAGWVARVGGEFVSAYIDDAASGKFLPLEPEATRRLLVLLVLEKALQEIDFELTFRPEWAVIPLQAVLRLLDGGDS